MGIYTFVVFTHLPLRTVSRVQAFTATLIARIRCWLLALTGLTFVIDAIHRFRTVRIVEAFNALPLVRIGFVLGARLTLCTITALGRGRYAQMHWKRIDCLAGGVLWARAGCARRCTIVLLSIAPVTLSTVPIIVTCIAFFATLLALACLLVAYLPLRTAVLQAIYVAFESHRYALFSLVSQSVTHPTGRAVVI